MKFTAEVNGRKLIVSSWQDAGKCAVMFNITKDGDDRAILLPFEIAEAMFDALDDILDSMSETADGCA